MTVKQLLRNTTARELEEWRTFEQIEPFGYLQEEYKFARLQAQIRNMMAGKEDQVLYPLDFMPSHPSLDAPKAVLKRKRTTPTQSVDQMKEIIKMIHGSKREGKKK